MNSPSNRSSPSFRHLKLKHQSPIELKEKMRKAYKNKVLNCRNMLVNKFRGQDLEIEVRKKLTDIYKEMFNFSEESTIDNEETSLLKEIENEIIQEELEWWLQEHEKSEMVNFDWSSLEHDDKVICPVCEKSNFIFTNKTVSCPVCKSSLKISTTPDQIRTILHTCIENHSKCNSELQFTIITEINDSHIYLICDTCMDMQLVL